MKVKFSHLFSVGLAVFAMLFGSGNIVFPLALGKYAGAGVWAALLGFIPTAVIIPIMGLISTMLCDGRYNLLLGKLGKVPAALAIGCCFALIGPFAIIPRCVVISYAALEAYIPYCSLALFSVLSSFLIFLFALKQNRMMDILGRFLGPLKVILLFLIIGVGVFTAGSLLPPLESASSLFVMGLKEGYNTLDLLGTIFFSGLIVSAMKQGHPSLTPKELAFYGLISGGIGGAFMALVYLGFCLIAALHAPALQGVETAQVFARLSSHLLGSSLGVLANITVAVSCFSTAMALTGVFTNYLKKEVPFTSSFPYTYLLAATCLVSAFMANLGFERIMLAVFPVIVIFYPVLIVLALVNIAQEIWGWRYVKTPVFFTFLVSCALHFLF